MKRVQAVIYVNFVSIVALVASIVNVIFNVISMIIEKLFVVPFAIAGLIYVKYLSELIVNNASSNIMAIIIFIVGIAILVTIMEILIGIFGSIFMMLFKGIAYIFSFMSDKFDEAFHDLVKSIINVLTKHSLLKTKSNKVIPILCFPFYIMYGFYIIINKMFKISLVIGGIISLWGIYGIYTILNNYYISNNDMGIFDYISSLGSTESILFVIQIVLLLIIVISVIMLIAFEGTLTYLQYEQENYNEDLKECHFAINNI